MSLFVSLISLLALWDSVFNVLVCNRERRQTWAEERRMNSETFGIPLRHNRGRGGFRGRGGMGFRGGRGRSASRGSFAPPRGAPPGFRGGFRGGRGGQQFSDFEYRVNHSGSSFSHHHTVHCVI